MVQSACARASLMLKEESLFQKILNYLLNCMAVLMTLLSLGLLAGPVEAQYSGTPGLKQVK
jgi:hypothetical protein